MNNRIANIVSVMVAFIGCFSAMVIAIFVYAYWDRRSMLTKAAEVSTKKIVEFEENGKFAELLKALREIAPDYPPLAESLKKFNLM